MGYANSEVDFVDLLVPGKVYASHLEHYFQVKYELDDKQVEALLLSSSESLNEILSTAQSVLAANDEDLPYEIIRGTVHRAKGLFLTMGQEKWAEYVAYLKKSSAGEVYSNLQMVVDNIQKNFSEITVLCEHPGK